MGGGYLEEEQQGRGNRLCKSPSGAEVSYKQRHLCVPHLDSQSSAGRKKNLPEAGPTVSSHNRAPIAPHDLQDNLYTVGCPQVPSLPGPCFSLQAHFPSLSSCTCNLTHDLWFPRCTVLLRALAHGIPWTAIQLPSTRVHLTSPCYSFKILFNITSNMKLFSPLCPECSSPSLCLYLAQVLHLCVDVSKVQGCCGPISLTSVSPASSTFQAQSRCSVKASLLSSQCLAALVPERGVQSQALSCLPLTI